MNIYFNINIWQSNYKVLINPEILLYLAPDTMVYSVYSHSVGSHFDLVLFCSRLMLSHMHIIIITPLFEGIKII
jgi:hypothetical protein